MDAHRASNARSDQAEERPGHSPAQHFQLGTQDEYLGVRRKPVHPEDAEELKDATGKATEERQGHGPSAGPNASELGQVRYATNWTQQVLSPFSAWRHPHGRGTLVHEPAVSVRPRDAI